MDQRRADEPSPNDETIIQADQRGAFQDSQTRCLTIHLPNKGAPPPACPTYVSAVCDTQCLIQFKSTGTVAAALACAPWSLSLLPPRQ